MLLRSEVFSIHYYFQEEDIMNIRAMVVGAASTSVILAYTSLVFTKPQKSAAVNSKGEVHYARSPWGEMHRVMDEMGMMFEGLNRSWGDASLGNERGLRRLNLDEDFGTTLQDMREELERIHSAIDHAWRTPITSRKEMADVADRFLSHAQQAQESLDKLMQQAKKQSSHLKQLAQHSYPIVNDSEKFSIKIALPDFEKEEVKAEITEGKVVISAEKKIQKETKDDRGLVTKSSSNKYFRNEYILPDDVDSAHYSMVFEKNDKDPTIGILTLTFRKDKGRQQRIKSLQYTDNAAQEEKNEESPVKITSK